MVKQSVVFSNLATRSDADMSQYLKSLLTLADVGDIEALYAGGTIEGRTPSAKLLRILQNLVDQPSADDYANFKNTPQFRNAFAKVNPDPQKKITGPSAPPKQPSTTEAMSASGSN